MHFIAGHAAVCKRCRIKFAHAHALRPLLNIPMSTVKQLLTHILIATLGLCLDAHQHQRIVKPYNRYVASQGKTRILKVSSRRFLGWIC